MRALQVVVIGLALAGCGLPGFQSVAQLCGWGDVRLAYEAHTTLADVGLTETEVQSHERGDLIVSADAIPLPHAAPNFSAAATTPPSARQFCFHPDGSNMTVAGILPNGWGPPE
jgi:hypothetical protein